MKNLTLLLIIAIFLGGVYYLGSRSQAVPKAQTEISIINGQQVIDLTAKGGYSPKDIQVKSGIPIKLRVITQNTFDCSSAFRIPKLNIFKGLPPSGVTEFDLPALQSGEVLPGNCSMGMYRFNLRAI